VADRGLNEEFKKNGIGQFHAQTWKAEDGKHPTDVIVDDSLVQAFEEVAQMVSEHPGTFFVPKPSPKDRDWGCGDLPEQKKDNRLSHMTSNYTGKVVKDVMAQNIHPTVKPIELMRRMIRLVSRPGHTIIDPFLGSGTTGVAAILEGRNFIGIERDPAYFKIASHRVASALEEMGNAEMAQTLRDRAA
jgi:DNA modification methylase